MTTRSLFKIEQFEKRLQEFAHQIPKFQRVEARVDKDLIDIHFYYSSDGTLRRIRVQGATSTGKISEHWGMEEMEYWGFADMLKSAFFC